MANVTAALERRKLFASGVIPARRPKTQTAMMGGPVGGPTSAACPEPARVVLLAYEIAGAGLVISAERAN